LKVVFIGNVNNKIKFCLILSFVLLITACSKNNPTENKKISNINSKTFNEKSAIAKVIKTHKDFPSNSKDTIIRKLVIGGPKDATTNVKFSTQVEKLKNNHYKITLNKDWGIIINKKYVKSSWKYDVSKTNIVLIESNDNDALPDLMK